MIKINGIGDKQCFVDIIELCNKAKSKSMRVDKKSCRDEIDALKQRRFSGVVKLISDFEEILSTEIIIFDSGKIKLFFIEEDGKNEEIETRPYDTEDGEGLLEIYECSNTQMKEFYIRDVKPYSVREIEKIVEAYKVIKKYGTVGPLKRIEQE